MSRSQVSLAGPRPIIAYALTAILAIGASIEYFGVAERLAAQAGDVYRIDAQVARFGPLAARISGTRVLGYFSDREKGSVAAQAALSSAQYSLAPALLVLDANHKEAVYWVGDFSTPGNYADIGAARGLQIVGDLGNGVILYQREKSR